MSVGGRVTDHIVLTDSVLIDTGEAAIYVARTPAACSISPGDTVWWQGRRAYWTPRTKAFHDMPLARIGNSFDRRRSTPTETPEDTHDLEA